VLGNGGLTASLVGQLTVTPGGWRKHKAACNWWKRFASIFFSSAISLLGMPPNMVACKSSFVAAVRIDIRGMFKS